MTEYERMAIETLLHYVDEGKPEEPNHRCNQETNCGGECVDWYHYCCFMAQLKEYLKNGKPEMTKDKLDTLVNEIECYADDQEMYDFDKPGLLKILKRYKEIK